MPTIPAPHSGGWLAIVAFVIGGIVRLLKTDTLGKALTAFFRPDGPPIVIPSRILPFLALGFGFGAATLDARVDGSSWDVALQSGVLAAALAVMGHELASGVPGLKKFVGGAVLIVFFGSTTTACALFTRENAPQTVDVIADKTKCALSHLDEPFESIVVKCLLTAEDVPRIRPLFATAREQAQHAADAARQDEQTRARRAGCAPQLDDGGK